MSLLLKATKWRSRKASNLIQAHTTIVHYILFFVIFFLLSIFFKCFADKFKWKISSKDVERKEYAAALKETWKKGVHDVSLICLRYDVTWIGRRHFFSIFFNFFHSPPAWGRWFALETKWWKPFFFFLLLLSLNNGIIRLDNIIFSKILCHRIYSGHAFDKSSPIGSFTTRGC